MSRSSWKIPFCKKSIINKFYLSKNAGKFIKIWSRSSLILPVFVDNTICVHDGKKFINLQIKMDMVGYKFGEFIPTRRKAIHKKK
uniref:ribosomal protein S19 n=1 Tax=Cryptomonas gyropyrenoidosa TaxID=233257 RepID=UPI00279ABEE6|nr:ribosomal protein S19 [Cryptomonas gyropyrenoidosa]WFQ82685.1 ribosomal protein S19 [Cryptomonas gyropyrenoidosa]